MPESDRLRQQKSQKFIFLEIKSVTNATTYKDGSVVIILNISVFIKNPRIIKINLCRKIELLYAFSIQCVKKFSTQIQSTSRNSTILILIVGVHIAHQIITVTYHFFDRKIFRELIPVGKEKIEIEGYTQSRSRNLMASSGSRQIQIHKMFPSLWHKCYGQKVS